MSRLIGDPCEAPPILEPAELRARYLIVATKLSVLTARLSDDHLSYRPPDRDRTLGELTGHAGSIMRAFIDVYDTSLINPALELAPDHVRTVDQLIAWNDATRRSFEQWWQDWVRRIRWSG